MNTLRCIYKQVKTLKETIDPLLTNRDVFIQDRILEYLESAICCFPSEQSINVSSLQPSSHSSHQQVIDRVIGSLLRLQQDHVICTGYRTWTGKQHVATLHNGVECFYPNPIVNHLKGIISTDRGFEWETIGELIGEEAVLFLLRNASIFLPCKNDCYYQICGLALDKLVGIVSFPLNISNVKSKGGNVSKSSTMNDAGRIEGDVTSEGGLQGVKRGGSFLERNTKKQKTKGHPTIGKEVKSKKSTVPWTQILYGKPVYSESGNIIVSLPPTHHLITLGAQALLEKVFEQRVGKMHWRVKQAMPLFKKMIRNHQACHYQALLDYYCSLGDPKRLKSDHLLELDTDAHQVEGFIKAALRRVIPLALFGTKKNMERFLNNVCIVNKLRRYESISVKMLVDGVQVSTIDWLKSNKKGSLPASDNLKKVELVEKMVYWIAHDYVFPLLSANFYITETGIHKYKLFYFRHKIWTRINAPLFQSIMSTMFEKVEESVVKQNMMGYNALGVATMRLLPKQTGARPIVNLSKKQTLRSNFRISVNAMLKNVFHVLCLEKKRKSEMFGSAAMGKNDIYMMLKEYKKRINIDGSQKFYICKVDITGCFNTIDQSILMQLLEELVEEVEYAVHKYTTVQLNQGKPRKRYSRQAFSCDDYFPLKELIEKYVDDIRNTVFIDSTSNPYEQRKSIFKLLEQHIFQHTIKIGQKYYRQKVGIPQGSVLSTLLCSLYYGYLERSELMNITGDLNSLLVRYIDDFIFISTDKLKVEQFATVMHAGFPKFGVEISPNKSLTNFDLILNGQEIHNVNSLDMYQIDNTTFFPWCGLLIDMVHLDVFHDFTRLDETEFKNSLTVELNVFPGEAILTKTKQFLRNLAHPIYLDTAFSRKETILCNVYQTYLFAALKLGATMDVAFAPHHINAEFVLKVVKEAIGFQLDLIRTGTPSEPITRKVSTQTISFLGYHAFATILSKKYNLYGPIVKLIKRELQYYPVKLKEAMASTICNPKKHQHLLNIKF